MPDQPQNASVDQVAALHGIPPAILSAVVTQMSGQPNHGMSESALVLRGFTGNELASDQSLALEIAARTLEQEFAQYGTWEQALSAYLTNDPSAYQNPNSGAGGQVEAILSLAGIKVGASPAGGNPQGSPQGYAALAISMAGHVGSGGMISQGHVNTAYQGGNPQPGSQGQNGVGFQNKFPFGQCTNFAYGVAPWLGGVTGNAADWLDSARQNGLPTGSKPTVGAVVVYGAGGGYDPQYGHVGVVTNVNPDGTFQVTSDHWGGVGQTHVGTSTMADVRGFIMPPSGEGQATANRALQATGSPERLQQVSTQARQPQPQTHPLAPPKQGATPDQQAQHVAKTANPAEVAQFAEQMKGQGIDPAHFIANFPFLANIHKMLGMPVPDLGTYAQYNGMTQSEMSAHARSTPHPTYPFLSVGDIWDSWFSGSLYSGLHTQRTPYEGEAARFSAAGLNAGQMENFYKTQAQQQAGIQQQQGGQDHMKTAPQ